MERVLVTGGAGFIGAHLTARLAARGHAVVVFDDLSWGDARKVESLSRVTLVRGDVRRIAEMAPELGSFSHVFHLAALISAHESLDQPDRYFETNVLGLMRVLELCATSARPRLVFASTSGIYGNSARPLKSEDDLPRPATVYAATKLTGEHLLGMYRSRLGFDDVALRFFNVYGPGQSPKHPYANVTCRFAHSAARGAPLQLYGDGAQTRDFIHVDDVVDAIMLVAFQQTRHRVYNVGTGRAASIGELLATVQRLAPKPVEVERCPPWQNDIQDICADVGRLQTELGFRAKVDLEAGLQQTIESFAHNGEAGSTW